MTMKGFRKALRRTKTLAVPYGTVEAHGDHLPLNTDTLVMTRVLERASEEVEMFVAPPLHYGVCTSTGQHPGTIGVTPSTLRAMTRDLVRDSFEKGLRNFLLISGHGGGLHVGAMKEAGEELTQELDGVRIAACSIYDVLGLEAFSIADTENDSHAGEMETSLVLHLAPGLVKGRSPEEYPELPKPVIARDKTRYWKNAVWGDPGKATEDKGRRFFEAMAAKVVELVKRLEKVKQ